MKVNERGTPKTLIEALTNGCDEFDQEDFKEGDEIKIEDLVAVLYVHVKDFLAQKFSVAVVKAAQEPLNDEEIHKLFRRIVK